MALVGTLAGAVGTASAEGDEPELKYLMACDLSACFVALRVVDSDDDGYADADERAAGTDPFDPASHPGVLELADLTLGRALPTAEYGLGVWVLLPDEVVEINVKNAGGLEALTEDLAFPVPTRKDAFATAGIDLGRLDELGVSLSEGFTLGFAPPTSSAGPKFEAKVAGLAKSWISADSSSTKYVTDGFGQVVFTIKTSTQTDPKTGDTTTTTTTKNSLGTTWVDTKTTGTRTTTTKNPDGSTTTTTVTTTTSTTNPNPQSTSQPTSQPTSGSTAQPTSQPTSGATPAPQPSSSSGGGASEEEEETLTTGEDDGATVITAENLARLLSRLGQNVRTVEPGTVPAMDWDDVPVKDPGALILVDPDYQVPFITLDPERALSKLDWNRTPVRDDLEYHPQYTGGTPGEGCEKAYCG